MSESKDPWRRLSDAYRERPRISPEAKERLLERISKTPPPRRSRWGVPLPWPGSGLRLAPAVTAAAVIGAFLLGALVTRVALGPRLDHTSSAGGKTPADSLVLVQFVLTAPGARSVSVAGDFNRWEAGDLDMVRVSPEGLWTVTAALARGSHLYSFVIDGIRWVADPTAPLGPDDGFGSPSSVVVVGGPGAT